MKRKIKKYLFDIQTSIDSINDYLYGNKDFFEYEKSKLIRRAVEREIEIIGEAMSRILKIDPNIKIQSARQIVDTRNWVIHGYDKVDDVVIWGIISKNLPELKKEIPSLLEKKI